jgi:hypothetical protein
LGRAHARDITIAPPIIPLPPDQPVSADIWQRDIEAILAAILDRMDQADAELWDKFRTIFERLQSLDEFHGQRQDDIVEHLRANLSEQEIRG